jgi:hypothetical protein
MAADKKLLESYIIELLREDFGGDFGGYGGDYGGYGFGGGGGMGMGYGSFGTGEDLYKTFIEPFVDVVKTAKASGEQVSVNVSALLQVAIKSLLTAAIPLWKEDYKTIVDKETKEIKNIYDHADDKIKAIRDKYGEVFKRTDEAFWTPDNVLIASMLAPGAMITLEAVHSAPIAVLSLLQSIFAGSDKAQTYLEGIKSKFAEVKRITGRWVLDPKEDIKAAAKKHKIPVQQEKHARVAWNAGLGAMANAIKSTAIQKELKKGKYAQNLDKQVSDVAKGNIDMMMQKLESIAKVNSITELEKATGNKVDLSRLEHARPENKEKLEKMIIDKYREAHKRFWILNIENKIKDLLKLGVPADAQYVQEYKNALQRMKSVR